jgi:DNA integrity scanning protein DisA with diadenylate cyclase activity
MSETKLIKDWEEEFCDDVIKKDVIQIQCYIQEYLKETGKKIEELEFLQQRKYLGMTVETIYRLQPKTFEVQGVELATKYIRVLERCDKLIREYRETKKIDISDEDLDKLIFDCSYGLKPPTTLY